MTDDFPEIDPEATDAPRIHAPTAEQLTGEVQAVRAEPATPSRDRVRSVRRQRRSRRRRRRGMWTVVAAVVVVAAGGAVWFALGDEPETEPQVSGVTETRPETSTSESVSTTVSERTTTTIAFIPVPEMNP